MDNFSEEEIEKLFKAIVERHEVKLGKLAQPVRVALTGGTQSPGIFEVIDVIGKDNTLKRLNKAVESI
jgi:glutamyl-tRNA synthetase